MYFIVKHRVNLPPYMVEGKTRRGPDLGPSKEPQFVKDSYWAQVKDKCSKLLTSGILTEAKTPTPKQ